MLKRLFGLTLAGSIVIVAGCTSLPGTSGAPESSATGTMNFGFAGEGYTVQAANDAANNKPATGNFAATELTFNTILFKPTKIELHYAGELADAQKQQAPADITGTSADQSEVNASDAGDTEATAEDGKWIVLPVENANAIDLAKLAANSVSFGEDPLKAGKYDQIRLTGGGSYDAVDASASVKTGEYFLPSGRLYIKQGFEIREGYKTDLKFAFNAKQSMVSAGSKVILKPNAVKVYADYSKVETATASAQ
ncbi:MAG TPA: DUF4382 domain-containing protein [Pantanalinema sp.]